MDAIFALVGLIAATIVFEWRANGILIIKSGKKLRNRQP
jgi:hypothetical protein